MSKTNSLKLDMSPEVKKKLDDLQTRTNAVNMGEVFRRALALYDFVITEKAKNTKILVQREGEEPTELNVF